MTALAQNTGYVAEGLGYLTSQWRNKPKMRGLVTALLLGKQELENAAFASIVQRRLASATINIPPATNPALDTLGKILGQLRLGLIDADYQQVLYLAAAVRHARGLVTDWSNFARIVLTTLASGPVQYWEGSNKGFAFAVFQIENTTSPLLPLVLSQVLARARPGGTNGRFVFTLWTNITTFTWGSRYGGAVSQGQWGSRYGGALPSLYAASLRI